MMEAGRERAAGTPFPLKLLQKTTLPAERMESDGDHHHDDQSRLRHELRGLAMGRQRYLSSFSSF